MKHLFVLLFMLSSFSFKMVAQELSENFLKSLKYEELLSLYNEFPSDSTSQEIIARAYLERARKDRDTIKMARGYDRLARIFHPEKNISFADSILELTQNKSHITYPGLAFIIKSFEFEKKENINGQLTNLLLALEKIDLNANRSQEVYVLHKLSLLQARWGDMEKAYKLQSKRHDIVNSSSFKNELEKTARLTFKEDIGEIVNEEKISSLKNWIYICLLDGNYQNANLFLNELNQFSFTLNPNRPSDLSSWIVEAKMEIYFHTCEYYKSFDLANRLLSDEPTGDRKSNILMYKGLALLELGDNTAIKYLQHADSINQYFTSKTDFYYDQLLLDRLYQYFTETNHSIKRIEYLDKLREIDSVLKFNYKFFEPEYISKFEKPIILNEKEAIINDLSKQKSKWLIISQIVFIFFLASSALLTLYFIRQRRYKRRFEAIFIQLTEKEEASKIEAHNSLKTEISADIVEDILLKLNSFEQNKKYLSPNISLNSLAKQLNTNSNYLSRVVNLKLEKNFAQYLHDLRIDYAVSELKKNEKIRKYTIKAIAEECGYSSAESFSRAFYRKNGIYPSYFIKQLNKTIT